MKRKSAIASKVTQFNNAAGVIQSPGNGIVQDSISYTDERYSHLKQLAEQHKKLGFDTKSKVYKFWTKQDWVQLKDDFYTASGFRAGTYKYTSIEEFIKDKWKGANREYAMLVVGPYPSAKVPWEGSWVVERFDEHWKQDKRVSVLSQHLQEQASASVISYSLASFYVDEIGKLKLWLDQLQKYSSGTLFHSPVKDTKKALAESRHEMRFILSMQSRLLNMLDQVRKSVQDSVGGQQAILANLVKGVMKDAINSPLMVGTDADRVQRLVRRMSEVAIARAELYETKLPDLDAIDVDVSNGKKSVQ